MYRWRERNGQSTGLFRVVFKNCMRRRKSPQTTPPILRLMSRCSWHEMHLCLASASSSWVCSVILACSVSSFSSQRPWYHCFHWSALSSASLTCPTPNRVTGSKRNWHRGKAQGKGDSDLGERSFLLLVVLSDELLRMGVMQRRLPPRERLWRRRGVPAPSRVRDQSSVRGRARHNWPIRPGNLVTHMLQLPSATVVIMACRHVHVARACGMRQLDTCSTRCGSACKHHGSGDGEARGRMSPMRA